SDKTTRLWDLNNPKAPPRKLAGDAAAWAPVHFSPDGTCLSRTSDGEGKTWTEHIEVWRLSEQPVRLPFSNDVYPVQPQSRRDLVIGFAADNRLLVTTTGDEVWLWSLENPAQQPRRLAGYLSALSPDGKDLATASKEPVSGMHHVILWQGVGNQDE